MRRKVWFKVLGRVERAIINLTIKCVKRVRSDNLVRIVAVIIDKLTYALKSRLERLMAKVGSILAQKLSHIAGNWGNKFAVQWSKDLGFIRYLAVTHKNLPSMFKV